MARRSNVRLLLTQPEAEVVYDAARLLEQVDTTRIDGRQRLALGRALDKMALALADARGRDADKGVDG